jgi:Zn-dependent protease with chaperone function
MSSKSVCAALLTATLIFLPGLALRADTASEQEAFEAALVGELTRENPEAVPIFADANAARTTGDLPKASTLYQKVKAMAPKFHHADRRRCGVEARLHHHALALELCNAALAAAGTPENRVAYAEALFVGVEPSALDLGRARELLDTALAEKPNDTYAHVINCELAILLPDMERLKASAKALETISPDEWMGYYFEGVHAANTEHWEVARAMSARAQKLGAQKEAIAALDTAIDNGEPMISKYANLAAWILVPWVSSFAVLMLVGALLSVATLRASKRVPQTATGHAQGLDAHLRRVYRVVLWLSCALYYVSLPIVLAIVIIGGGGIIYGFFALGHVPVKLVAIVGIIVLLTVVATVKSLFVKRDDSDPGLALDLAQNPKLGAVLGEVARNLSTRTVEHVYVTTGTDLAVFERGGMLQQLRGRSRRCLILGLGILDGMRVRELKGVLAHEYGHFVNEDTAGGGFSLAVRRSLVAMAIGLAESGAARMYNPAWLFVRGFFWVFMRISFGASRLQEVLADRWSAFAYGSEAFERGLRHAIERSVRFSAHIDASVNEALKTKMPMPNLYRFQPAMPADETSLKDAIDAAINAKPSPLDSHPSPADRIAWVRALNASGAPMTADDEAPASALFGDYEALEKQITNDLRARVAVQTGITIPA